MQHLIPFLMANWPLSLAALILIIILFVMEIRNFSHGMSMISPNKAAILMNKKNCQIVDVRSAEAYKNGHINKAKNYPLSQLKSDITVIKSKKDPVLVVCEAGLDSKKAGAYLKSQGFEQLYAIEGGLKQWRKENYPLSKTEG